MLGTERQLWCLLGENSNWQVRIRELEYKALSFQGLHPFRLKSATTLKLSSIQLVLQVENKNAVVQNIENGYPASIRFSKSCLSTVFQKSK